MNRCFLIYPYTSHNTVQKLILNELLGLGLHEEFSELIPSLRAGGASVRAE